MKIKRLISIMLSVLLVITSAGITAFSADSEVTEVNVMCGEEYSLPQEIDGQQVTWENSDVDATSVGYGLYKGTLADSTAVTYRVNVGEWKTIASDDMENHQAGTSAQGNATVIAGAANGLNLAVANNAQAASATVKNVDGNNVLEFQEITAADNLHWTAPNTTEGKYRISFDISAMIDIEGDSSYDSTGSYVRLYDTVGKMMTHGHALRIYKGYGVYVGSTDGFGVTNAYKKWSIENEETDSLASADIDMAIEVDSETKTYTLMLNGKKAEGYTDVSVISGSNGIFGGIRVARRNGNVMVDQFDNLVCQKAVYPTGDILENPVKASIETGAESSQSQTVLLDMSDGSKKSITVNYTVDTQSAGVKNVNGTAEGFNFDIPVEVTVEEAPVVIKEINSLLEKEVYTGDSFTLPSTVNVKLSDASNADVSVTWSENADTSTRGIKNYSGVIEAYDNYPVTFVLNVKAAVRASSLVGIGDSFTLPETYNGEEVEWEDSNVDTSFLGQQIKKGTLPDGSELVCTVNVGEKNVLFEDDMESYTVGGKNPDYGDNPNYGDDGGLSLGAEKCAIVYENGTDGNKMAKILVSNEWGSFKFIAPTPSQKDYVLTGRVKFDDDQDSGSLTRMVIYNSTGAEVAGMYVDMDGIGVLRIKNSTNIGVSSGANPDAANVKGIAITDYNGQWVDFKIAVDAANCTYDVYANGLEVRTDCPLNLDGLKDASFKSASIKRYGTINPVSFDDFKVTEYTYVADKLPEKLTDSVVSTAGAQRVQKISLKMNDGTIRQFDVNYTIDPETSGIQNVLGYIEGFSESIPVEVSVDARSIVEIKPESLSNQSKVYIGSEYTLPVSVTAIMSENDSQGSNEKVMNVEWDGIADTSVAGEFTFTGLIVGYDEEIVYTLTVSKDKPISVSEIEVTKDLNEPYSLPTVVPVNMESGIVQDMEVNWNGSVARTDEAGSFSFDGYIIGYPPIGDDAGIPVSLILTVEPSKVKAVTYGDKDYLDIKVENTDKLPKKIRCEYENGMFGFEEVTWDISQVTPTSGPHTITGTLTTTELAAGFDGSVNAKLSIYELPAEPGLEDGLDTHVWDGPYGEDKFPVGMTLLVSPYRVNNGKGFKSVEDPVNSGNRVIQYENKPEYDANNKLNYCGMLMSSAKTGVLVAQTKMYLPLQFTAVTYRIMTGQSTQLCQFDLLGDRSIDPVGSGVIENAFPLEEWFDITLVTDTTAKDPSGWFYDLYINGVYLSTEKWYMEPSATNGVGTTGARYIDWRNDKDEDFVMYIDDVKFYFLNDLMEDAYTAVNDVPTVVQNDSIYLPEGAGETLIEWSSSDESVISNEGVVTRPAYNEENKTVTLTATLSTKAGCFEANDTKTISVKVMKAGATDADLVSEAIESLTVPSETSSDINLRTSFGKAEITWNSSNPSVIDEEGRVFPVDEDTDVTLTATVKSGSITQSQTFTVKVKYTDELSDIQKVRNAMNNVSIPSETSQNLSLPTSVEGVHVTWSSGNLSYIKSDGTLVSGRSGSKTVTLTAVFTLGDIRETKEYSVNVEAPSQSSGGGGGGGGSFAGSSSKSDYVEKTPAIEEAPVITTEKFIDMQDYAWAKEAVEALSDINIINGVGNKKFAPSNNVKREEFTAMIVRLAELGNEAKENVFEDISENDWFCKEINVAYEESLIKGIGEGKFGAGMNITRQDMAVILYNLSEHYAIDTQGEYSSDFADNEEIASYAKEAVSFLNAKGVINGIDGNMMPHKNATRAEAAKMIYEFIKAFEIKDLNTENISAEETVSSAE